MFEMKPEYYIGIKMIDEQHKQLFKYADEAYELRMTNLHQINMIGSIYCWKSYTIIR